MRQLCTACNGLLAPASHIKALKLPLLACLPGTHAGDNPSRTTIQNPSHLPPAIPRHTAPTLLPAPPTSQDGIHAVVPHAHHPAQALQLVLAQAGLQAVCTQAGRMRCGGRTVRQAARSGTDWPHGCQKWMRLQPAAWQLRASAADCQLHRTLGVAARMCSKHGLMPTHSTMPTQPRSEPTRPPAPPGCTSTSGGRGGRPADCASAAPRRMVAATSEVMKGRSTCRGDRGDWAGVEFRVILERRCCAWWSSRVGLVGR